MKYKLVMLYALLFLQSCDDNDNVNVLISSGKTQCENNALPINVTRSYLESASIDVIKASCGNLTGVAYADVCGGGTADIHIFTIDKKDLNEAVNIGFTDPSKLQEGVGYETKTCTD